MDLESVVDVATCVAQALGFRVFAVPADLSGFEVLGLLLVFWELEGLSRYLLTRWSLPQ